MSEKVEEVAKAIFAANAGAWRGETWEQAGGDIAYSSAREAYFREAHAAIAAMREPTDAMVDAAIAPYRHKIDEKMRAAFDETIRGYWRSMIDEMLK